MHLRPFEIGLIGVFAVLALGGLIFFASYKAAPNPADKPYGDKVIIWGTFDQQDMEIALSKVFQNDKKLQVVKYVEKDPRTFEFDLINAIAQGNSPDLIVLPHPSLISLRKVIAPISYSTFPQRAFRDRYIDGAEIFMMSDGLYGVPFAVDPIVMYWNRSLFTTAGFVTPPRTWESLLSQAAPALTKQGQSGIAQSAVAFGEYSNVLHAKDVLSMLFLQAGSTIVEEKNNSFAVTLDDQTTSSLPPGEAVLSFYTQFVSPASRTYSWDRSLGLDRDKFIGGALALYFGPGSEYSDLRKKNPNLNFDVTLVPQGSNASIFRDYGTFYAFAVLNASQNKRGAYNAALALASDAQSLGIVEGLNLAPVSRALLGAGSPDPGRSVLYQEAAFAFGWLDPSSDKTNEIFRAMVEDITSGRKRLSQSVQDAVGRIRLLFYNN